MKYKSQIAGVLIIAGLVTLLVVQNQSFTRLQKENDGLQDASKQLEQLRDENAQLAKLAANTNELAQLRKDRDELLRLRNEVHSLREKLKSAASQQKQSKPIPHTENISSDSNQPASAVTKYQSVVNATVPSGFSLATGGWETQPGKRMLVLNTPIVAEGGQVEIRTRYVEMPDAVFDAHGFNYLKAEGTESKGSGILSDEKAAALLKAFEKTEGVDVVAAPSVTTLSGRQAQVQVLEMWQTMTGETQHIGPVLDVIPHITADRNSVQMSVIVNLTRLASP